MWPLSVDIRQSLVVSTHILLQPIGNPLIYLLFFILSIKFFMWCLSDIRQSLVVSMHIYITTYWQAANLFALFFYIYYRPNFSCELTQGKVWLFQCTLPNLFAFFLYYRPIFFFITVSHISPIKNWFSCIKCTSIYLVDQIQCPAMLSVIL